MEPQANTFSEWQEKVVIEGLTLYDIEREPRYQVPDEITLTFHQRNLNRELTCPICLGILQQTWIVMEVPIFYRTYFSITDHSVYTDFAVHVFKNVYAFIRANVLPVAYTSHLGGLSG